MTKYAAVRPDRVETISCASGALPSATPACATGEGIATLQGTHPSRLLADVLHRACSSRIPPSTVGHPLLFRADTRCSLRSGLGAAVSGPRSRARGAGRIAERDPVRRETG